jgi:hypothetical protein
MFRDALAESGDGAPQLMDIAQLAARGLPKNETAQILSFPGLKIET